MSMQTAPSSSGGRPTTEDLAAWHALALPSGGDDAPDGDGSVRGVSSTLGQWRAKRRRLDRQQRHSPPPETEANAENAMRFSHCAASAASSSSPSLLPSLPAAGSLSREYAILAQLHARGVQCAPRFAALLTLDDDTGEAATEVLVQEQVGGAALSGDSLLAHSGLAAALVSSLLALHSAGIVHADLKPEHIIVRASDGGESSSVGSAAATVGLIDFDLSEAVAASPLAHPACFRGTPAYASLSLHLGCTPSPATDYESAVWIILELLVRARHAGWRLPWRANKPREDDAPVDGELERNGATLINSAVDSESVPAVASASVIVEDALFNTLRQWMESQSWSVASIHRAGHEKLASILGTASLCESAAQSSQNSAGDRLFTLLTQAIRPQLLRLVLLAHQTPNQVNEGSALLGNILNELLACMRRDAEPAEPGAAVPAAEEIAAPSSSSATFDLTTIELIERQLAVNIARDSEIEDLPLCLNVPVWSASPLPSQPELITLPCEEEPTSSDAGSSSSPTVRHQLLGVCLSLDDVFEEDGDDLVHRYPELCSLLSQLEESCSCQPGRSSSRDEKTTPSPSTHPISMLHHLHQSRTILILRVLPRYSLATIGTFFGCLLASDFFFTLPRVRLAICLNRAFILWPESSVDDVTVNQGADGKDADGDDDGADPGTSWLQQMLRQQRTHPSGDEDDEQLEADEEGDEEVPDDEQLEDQDHEDDEQQDSEHAEQKESESADQNSATEDDSPSSVASESERPSKRPRLMH